jgi:hypothetical protein
LAALLVWLHFRLYLPIRRYQAFSGELLGLSLSTGAIAQASHEVAHACEPVPQWIQQEVLQSALLHGDETPHYQAGEFLCAVGGSKRQRGTVLRRTPHSGARGEFLND